jgi:hypothetical protein
MYSFLGNLAVVGILAAAASLLSVCASENGQAGAREEISLLGLKSPQQVVYNGQPQAISYQYTGDGKPDITYYPTLADRANDRRGSRTAPVNAGTYYVRLVRPEKTKPKDAKDYLAELRILKRPVKISADKVQTAFYNGDPKRVQVTADPEVTLFYSYYPNSELREAAEKAEREAVKVGAGAQQFKGYRRVERAPSEQGTYYVWIYFPGDDNHESASADVEFTILPHQ